MDPAREPAAYAEVTRLVILALVALGWVTVDSNTTNTIATAIGTILSVVLSLVVRQNVVPVAKISDTPPNEA